MHFALQKLHILPHVLAEMSLRELVLLYASIELRVEQEKREQERQKHAGRQGRRPRR